MRQTICDNFYAKHPVPVRKIVPSVSSLCGMAGSTLSAPFSVVVVLTSVIPAML